MRKGLLYIAILGLTVALAGCGKQEELQPHGQQTDFTAEEEEITGEAVSFLTGLPISDEVQNSRPLAVMLNNKEEGCPQSGIADAAIVYEAPVEGRITRLMALYDDYRNLEKVGSIRSSRDYFVYFALEYDAIYAHFGQATPYVGDLLNSDKVDNISGAVAGIKHPATKTFYDEPSRKAPHQKYLTSERLQKDIEKFVIMKRELLYIENDELELKAAEACGIGTAQAADETTSNSINEVKAVISGVINLSSNVDDKFKVPEDDFTVTTDKRSDSL